MPLLKRSVHRFWEHRQKAYSFKIFSAKNQFLMLHIARILNFWIKPYNLRNREWQIFKRTNLPACQQTWISCLRQQQKSHKFVFSKITNQQIIGLLCFSLYFICDGKLHHFRKHAGFRVCRFYAHIQYTIKQYKCRCCGSILSFVQFIFSFVLYSLSCITIRKKKQRKIKIKPRIKVNQNINAWIGKAHLTGYGQSTKLIMDTNQ